MSKDTFAKNMAPVWAGDCVFRETVMFVGHEDRAPLLYHPTQILSVTSYGGEISYVEGEDFVCNEDGTLSLTPDTRIPYIKEEEFYHNDPSSLISIPYKGKETFVYWGEGTTMTRWQLAVTYEHDSRHIEAPRCYRDRFSAFLGKMERGENVTVVFYGDSITAGANSSYESETPPFLPPWNMLFSEYLARRYEFCEHFVRTGLPRTLAVPAEDLVCGDRGVLTYINTAVPGWTSADGLANIKERILDPVAEHGCDLFVLAFGMNDKRFSPEEHVSNLRAILQQLLEAAPNASVLLVSPMYPNPVAPRWCINQPLFESEVIKLADEYTGNGIPCAVVPMTSVSAQLLLRKRFHDYSGNNVNHPNDFMIRLYAQAMVQTMLG